MPSTSDRLPDDAAYLSLAGMEGLPGVIPVRNRFDRATFARIYPGLVAAGTAALAATWLAQHYQTPVMLFALLFGMAFNFLHQDGRCVPGIEFASRTILRCGVALLGARITVEQIMALGLTPILLVVAGVVSTLLVGLGAARLLKLPANFGVLSGGAVAICGASAALAIAAVLPSNKESQRDTVLAVVIVTTLSTIAMIVYPGIVGVVGLDAHGAGIFLGGTIHDVAQVVGAGYSVSPEAGDVATVIKLLRVALLAPLVAVIAVTFGRAVSSSGPRSFPVPMFLLAFVAMVIVHSLHFVPEPVADGTYELSRWCLVTAIAALGMKTSLKTLVTVGWRPVALMVGETVWIASLILASLLMLR